MIISLSYNVAIKWLEMEETQIQIAGYEMLEKKASRSGNSGRVYVPVEWIGKRVKIILLENNENIPEKKQS
jgi:putative transposon-encoded protein